MPCSDVVRSDRPDDVIRHRRAYKILARTVHLVSTGILLGAHVMGAAKGSLRTTLCLALISGAVMFVLEAHPDRYLSFETWELLVFAKLALLFIVAIWWSSAVQILIVVTVIGAIGSHLPRNARHWSIFDQH